MEFAPSLTAGLHLNESQRQSSASTPGPVRRLALLDLEEASYLTRRSKKDLLIEGEAGELTFYFRPPPGYQIRLVDQRAGVSDEVPPWVPNIIALTGPSVASLREWGKTAVTTAIKGASVTPNQAEDLVRLLYAKDANVYQDWKLRAPIWASWDLKDASGGPISVAQDDLRLAKAEVELRFGLRVLPRSGPGDRGDQAMNYRSTFLQYVNQAAMVLWGADSVDLEDSSTWPTTEEIGDWIRRRAEWDDSEEFLRDLKPYLATSIAAIIRPDGLSRSRFSAEPLHERDPRRPRRAKGPRR